MARTHCQFADELSCRLVSTTSSVSHSSSSPTSPAEDNVDGAADVPGSSLTGGSSKQLLERVITPPAVAEVVRAGVLREPDVVHADLSQPGFEEQVTADCCGMCLGLFSWDLINEVQPGHFGASDFRGSRASKRKLGAKTAFSF